MIAMSGFTAASAFSSGFPFVSDCFPAHHLEAYAKEEDPARDLEGRGIVMLKKLKMNVPATPSTSPGRRSTLNDETRAVRARMAGSWPPVRARNIGSAANGSTIDTSDPKQRMA